jgi:hypothetical protein
MTYSYNIEIVHRPSFQGEWSEVFENADWMTSGDYILILQEGIKTVMPLCWIKQIKPIPVVPTSPIEQ